VNFAADDATDIARRLREIREEESAFCKRCLGCGWIPVQDEAGDPVTWMTCSSCGNPRNLILPGANATFWVTKVTAVRREIPA
jgi:hypothetical protein